MCGVVCLHALNLVFVPCMIHFVLSFFFIVPIRWNFFGSDKVDNVDCFTECGGGLNTHLLLQYIRVRVVPSVVLGHESRGVAPRGASPIHG